MSTTARHGKSFGQDENDNLLFPVTGREVDAKEALGMGLVTSVVPKGKALEAAITLAKTLTSL